MKTEVFLKICSGARTAVIVAILFLVQGCTYDFSEDYYNEIEISDPSVNISLMGIANGEEVTSARDIRYSFSGTGSGDFEAVFSIDGVEIHVSNQRTGQFSLPVYDLNDGQHKLSVDFIFPTNSGSLADAIGGEFYTGEAEYSFAVNKSLADSFGIASVNIRDGSIYITLNPVTDDNFDYAYLLIQNDYGVVVDQRPISPEDLADLEIHDSQTLMENPSYAIKVENAFYEDTSEFVLLPTPDMEFAVAPLDYRSFKLSYKGHPLYGNFDIFGYDYTYTATGSSFQALDPEGGEQIVDQGYYFGGTFLMTFKIFKDNNMIQSYSEELQMGSNLPVSEFEDMTYVPAIDKYFILDVSNSRELIIHQLSAETLKVEKSKTLTTLSFPGDFNSMEKDPVSNNLIINLNKRALVFDPLNYSILSVHKAVDYDSNKSFADVYYRGDHIILEDDWSYGDVVIYDKVTGIEKLKVQKTTSFFSAVDLSFFYANGDLYKAEAGNFVKIKTLQDSENNRDAPALDFMVFDKTSNSAVFGWYRSTYYLDLENGNQKYIWTPDDVYDVKYAEDGRPLINSRHFSAGTRSHLYDAQNDETRMIDTYGDQLYRYFNGTIFSPNGFYLQSELYIN